MSEFERYVLQRVRFWIEGIKKRWILDANFYNDSELEKIFAFCKSTLVCFHSVKLTDFDWILIETFLQRASICIENIATSQILNELCCNGKDFDLKITHQ